QADDGIRDDLVTGVQTCALPIWIGAPASDQIPPMLLELRQPHESEEIPPAADDAGRETTLNQSLNAQVGHIKIFGIDACVFRFQIGRASCRARRMWRVP